MLFLLFQIGHDRYALEARHAVEVVPLLAMKKIPQAPHGVAGIFNYRGQPVAALDLCELTLGRPARERLSTRIIVCQVSETGDRPLVGLVAEHATEMMQRDEREFVDSGVKIGAAPYLGPVLLDGKGVIQLIRASGLAAFHIGGADNPTVGSLNPPRSIPQSAITPRVAPHESH